MSDRRPENLYVYRRVDDFWPPEYDYEPATVDEALAVVRRGVESGEIEGELRGWCAVHDAQSWDGRDLFCLLQPGDPEERSCRMEQRLVIREEDK